MGLLDLLMGRKPPQQPPQQQQGLLGGAKDAMSDRDAYNSYVEEQAVAGKKPMPYPEWAKQRQPKK